MTLCKLTTIKQLIITSKQTQIKYLLLFLLTKIKLELADLFSISGLYNSAMSFLKILIKNHFVPLVGVKSQFFNNCFLLNPDKIKVSVLFLKRLKL